MSDPRATAQRLAKKFAAAFGSDLRSVVLFGSVARGEAIPGMSDVNVLMLVDSVTPTHLASAAPMALEWVRSGNTPPHLFSTEEWKGMGDTFAIEIADMQDAREIVYGDDPVSTASLEPADIRLHAEHEIRDTMLQLRLRMLLAANDPRELGNLLVSGIPSFTAYIRAALRLSGHQAPLDTLEAIDLAGKLIDADASPLRGLQEARRRLSPPSLAITDPIVAGYIDFVRQLAGYIDQLET